MSLNQFAFGAMNPVTMWDPTGMMPQCAFSCTGNQEQNLVENWSQAYGETVRAGTGGSSGYSPSPPPPDPAPAINHTQARESYSVLDECFRRCGTGDGSSIDWGTTTDAESDTACPATCSSGWRGLFGQVLNGARTCISPWSGSCASSVQGLAARAVEDTVGGGECYWNSDTSHSICTGVSRKLATPPGGAFVVGNNITVDEGARFDAPLASHEGGHVRQADAMGVAYIPAYLANTVYSYAISGTNDCNLMEIDAGPGGNYGSCSPWWAA